MMRSQESYLGCGGKSWLLLSGPKSSLSENKVCISFGNQRPKVWRKNWIDIAWRPVRHFHSQWWFRGQVMLVLLRCVFWSPQSSQPSIPGNDTALRASFGRQALWEMTISFSSRTGHLTTLPKVPKAGSITVALLCSTRRQTWTDGGGGQEEEVGRQTQQCRWTKRLPSEQLGLPLLLSSGTNSTPYWSQTKHWVHRLKKSTSKTDSSCLLHDAISQ